MKIEFIKTSYKDEKGLIAGCWYYNHNSLKTQEAAGLYRNSRLIKIKI